VTKTPAEHQRDSREARAKEGGRQLATWLDAPAAEKLDRWIAKGETVKSVINRLLTRSKP
jgi:hypothetical protein